jgi:predicted 3-demethylubiquinone-9 3-methyltransferase (glyoxalase superfamily)
MSCFSLENQMFLLKAIKETSECFNEEESYSVETQTINQLDYLFGALESMENRLQQLSTQSA